MKYKIVADSAADMTEMAGDVPFSFVPLHIIVDGQDYTDNEKLDTEVLQEALVMGKTSSSACPSPEDWLTAFEDAEYVYCVTITSGLSGSYASAEVAKGIYEEKHPGRKVFLVDSLATGSKMVLLCYKLRELIEKDLGPEQIYQEIMRYHKQSYLYFALASLENMAKNGRVNPILAKGLQVLGIRIVGTADEEGHLKPLGKSRGDKRTVRALVNHMKNCCYHGTPVVITHHNNAATAKALRDTIIAEFGTKEVEIRPTRGLCSYYAEPGSVLVGFDV
jgi:DegV family protein with EDD domain